MNVFSQKQSKYVIVALLTIILMVTLEKTGNYGEKGVKHDREKERAWLKFALNKPWLHPESVQF